MNMLPKKVQFPMKRLRKPVASSNTSIKHIFLALVLALVLLCKTVVSVSRPNLAQLSNAHGPWLRHNPKFNQSSAPVQLKRHLQQESPVPIIIGDVLKRLHEAKAKAETLGDRPYILLLSTLLTTFNAKQPSVSTALDVNTVYYGFQMFTYKMFKECQKLGQNGAMTYGYREGRRVNFTFSNNFKSACGPHLCQNDEVWCPPFVGGGGSSIEEQMTCGTTLPPGQEVLCEIGTQHGYSSIGALHLNRPKLFVSFDLAMGAWSGPVTSALRIIYNAVQIVQYKGHVFDNLPVFKKDFPKLKCNQLFIDGCHDFAAAVSDTIAPAALQIVDKDTILIFDDIQMPLVERGVKHLKKLGILSERNGKCYSASNVAIMDSSHPNAMDLGGLKWCVEMYEERFLNSKIHMDHLQENFESHRYICEGI